MLTTRTRWALSVLVAALVTVGGAASGPLEPASMNVYFGSLGAYPFVTSRPGGYRADFEVARDVDRMDFLAIAAPTSTSELRRIADSTSAASAGRFVAMWSWQYGSLHHGNYVNLLELTNLDEGSIPSGRYDLFFRTWLTRHNDVTGHPPIVQFPHPREMALDYGIANVESPEALAQVAAPFVRTVELVRDQSRATGQSRLEQSDWTPYLNYLNVGFRIAPTADVARRTETGPGATERRTAILAPQLTKASLLESIRERRVYASEDRNLKIAFSINGRPMGSIVSLAPDTPLRIEVTFSDVDEPNARYALSLRRDVPGGAIEAARELLATSHSGDGRVEWTQLRRNSRDEYFLVRILQEGSQGIDTLWTAPIWLTEH